MSNNLDWAQLGLATMVLAISIGGSYLSGRFQTVKNTATIESIQRRDAKAYQSLLKLDDTLSELNGVLIRLDERVKFIERRP